MANGSGTSNTKNTNRIKIVLVDDDRDLQELFTVIGRHENIETVYFDSGLKALEYLARNDADAVIIDLRLPVIDGLRLAKQIRFNEEVYKKQNPVKMVFYTGEDFSTTIKNVADRVHVAKKYLIHKPFDLGDIITELKKDINNKQESI